jgi:uncharacterized DUF497 family protein
MEDHEFTWDDTKAEENLKKHRVSFATARHVFGDPSPIEDYDSDSSFQEDRFFIIGEASGKVYFVVYAIEGDRIRIISARQATRREINAYYSGKTAG